MRVSAFARAPLVLLLALLLAACGFRLAGDSGLPEQLARIQLITTDFNERQGRALQARLRRAGAEISLQPAPQAVQLRVRLKTLPNRRLVSSASNRKIIERVSRELEFSVKTAAGELLAPAASLLRSKDIVLDDDNLLSSTVERQNVVEDLENALFDQLLQQLRRL